MTQQRWILAGCSESEDPWPSYHCATRPCASFVTCLLTSLVRVLSCDASALPCSFLLGLLFSLLPTVAEPWKLHMAVLDWMRDDELFTEVMAYGARVERRFAMALCRRRHRLQWRSSSEGSSFDDSSTSSDEQSDQAAETETSSAADASSDDDEGKSDSDSFATSGVAAPGAAAAATTTATATAAAAVGASSAASSSSSCVIHTNILDLPDDVFRHIVSMV